MTLFHCDALASAKIAGSVTNIETGAFADCPNLTIECTENSAAHEYAVAEGIAYLFLSDAD